MAVKENRLTLHQMISPKMVSLLTSARDLVHQPRQIIHELQLGKRRELPRLWNSLALILGRVASSGLGFLTWLFTARLYATSEVGIASGVVSAMMLCVQFSLLGIGSAYISYYPVFREKPSRLLNTTLHIVSGVSLLMAGLFVIFASSAFRELNVVSSQLAYVLLFLGITLFGAVNVLMDNISIAMRRSDQVLFRNILFGVVTVVAVAGLPLITQNRDSITIVLAWTLAGLSACALGAFQLVRSETTYRYRPEVDSLITKNVLRVGFPNYLLTLAERAPNWILPILVTELLSPVDNAHWYTVWMMAWVVFIVPISISQNLFAEVSRRPVSLNEAVRHTTRTSLVLGGGAAVIVIVLAPFMLSLLGKGYATAGTLPLRILALAVIPVVFIQAYYAVCRGMNRLREANITGLVSGLIGILVATVAGVLYGLTGMAIGWLVTQSVAGIWAGIRLRHMTGEPDGVKILGVSKVSEPDNR